MSRNTLTSTAYAPFYIHRFRPVLPHTIVEAEKFNLRYTSLAQIENMPDKLRWCRYQLGLLQREIAAYLGVHRSTYVRYEEAGNDWYPIDTLLKLAELFSVPVTDLMDAYNLFLYNGQGRQVREMRKRRNMTQAEYAKLLGVAESTVLAWEQESKQMHKENWQRLITLG